MEVRSIAIPSFKFPTFFHSVLSLVKDSKFFSKDGTFNREFRTPNLKYFKNIKALVVIVVILLVFLGGYKVLEKIDIKDSSNSSNKIELKPARASQTLNKEFSFPLKNEKGEEVAKVNYTIETAELRDEIIVKGKQAKSVKGRTFLVFNIKIKNEFTKSIEINSKDYVRLSVSGNEEEWLAPDIHNDPVEVQAISTKPTRVGFAINEDTSNLVLRIGEISGEKEKITLDLK